MAHRATWQLLHQFHNELLWDNNNYLQHDNVYLVKHISGSQILVLMWIWNLFLSGPQSAERSCDVTRWTQSNFPPSADERENRHHTSSCSHVHVQWQKAKQAIYCSMCLWPIGSLTQEESDYPPMFESPWSESHDGGSGPRTWRIPLTVCVSVCVCVCVCHGVFIPGTDRCNVRRLSCFTFRRSR